MKKHLRNENTNEQCGGGVIQLQIITMVNSEHVSSVTVSDSVQHALYILQSSKPIYKTDITIFPILYTGKMRLWELN